MEGIKDEMGDGMQCIDHPHRNNPGGICAFCLQEKLGKLVSSSFPLPITAAISSPSSSSSPSFRSHTAPPPTSSLPLSVPPISAKKNTNDHDPFMRSRLPFLLPKKKKKKPSKNPSSSSSTSVATSDDVFKRSKSTATPRRGQFLDDEDNFSPRKRNGFWSFLYLSSSAKTSASSSKKLEAKSFRDSNGSPRISTVKPRDKSSLGRKSDMVVVEEDVSPNSQASASSSSLERKVSRSRSVGCGSRSFSGDFFERISTGLGDCTLRRVESQREGKPKVGGGGHGATTMMNNHHCMKERVRCGGIFGGFMMMTSSSSSSSSSSYWVSSTADDGELSHGKGKSWGWALASPMRAFSSKASSKKNNKRDANSEKNTTPNLSAVPSLLTVRG